MTKERRIPVMEIFGPTIQGEGLMSGTVTHFLRTGGCGLRCTWCDTMFAVDPKQVKAGRTLMTTGEIITAISGMTYAPYLTLTGGDPCLHKTLGEIIFPLNVHGIKIAVETQGELFPDWLADVDVITFSPKPPSSGNTIDYRDIYEWLHALGGRKRPMQVCIKIVIFDQDDLNYALDALSYFPDYMYDAFYFTAGTPGYPLKIREKHSPEISQAIGEARAMNKLMGVIGSQRTLADAIVQESKGTRFNHKFHIGSQQHVIIWPEIEQGV